MRIISGRSKAQAVSGILNKYRIGININKASKKLTRLESTPEIVNISLGK
jgi:hypothetical protein